MVDGGALWVRSEVKKWKPGARGVVSGPEMGCDWEVGAPMIWERRELCGSRGRCLCVGLGGESVRGGVPEIP